MRLGQFQPTYAMKFWLKFMEFWNHLIDRILIDCFWWILDWSLQLQNFWNTEIFFCLWLIKYKFLSKLLKALFRWNFWISIKHLIRKLWLQKGKKQHCSNPNSEKYHLAVHFKYLTEFSEQTKHYYAIILRLGIEAQFAND